MRDKRDMREMRDERDERRERELKLTLTLPSRVEAGVAQLADQGRTLPRTN